MVKPVRLEIIAPLVQGPGICTSCEIVLAEAGLDRLSIEQSLDEYPQEWRDEWQRLTDWVYDLAGRYGDRLLIKVIDPQSPEGVLKSLRYRVRCYPTFIVAGKKMVGWEPERLEAALASELAAGES